MASSAELPVDENLFTGIDVGGTKVHIKDTASTNLHRFATTGYSDIYGVLDEYFAHLGKRPKRVIVAMAGPRDDDTGAVKMTNCDWPLFVPQEADARYPATHFDTSNDLLATVAGVTKLHSTDYITIKPGKVKPEGTRVAVAISTGVGVGVAVYSHDNDGFVYMATEAGHMGFMPYTEHQRQYLKLLFGKYSDPSLEWALSGKFGAQNWVEYLLHQLDAPELTKSIEHAAETDLPVGAVLLEYAREGHGKDMQAAHAILNEMAELAANGLADYALAYKATGGIYLTGSVALSLGEYWAEHTNFRKVFTRHGTPEHAPWLENFLNNIPIYLITDPHIAVNGALSLAQEQQRN